MPIITDLAPPGTTEGFILDPTGTPLDVVSGGSFGMVSLVMPPAKRRPEWASSGDADGSELVREPYYYDRECTMQLRVQTTSMDQAVSAIGLLQGKLQEAIKLAAGGGAGLAFLWTPAHATVGLTGYMMLGEITDMPIDWNGWFQAKPTVTVAFTAKPFLYGAEVTGPTATGTAPLLTVAVPSVPGDVPAEARLVVTDGSSQTRRWVEGGLEQRYYNAGAPSSLLIDSEDLVTSGFAGTLAIRTGGYRRASATHDTVFATLLTPPIAVCGTGNLPHIGTFRVKARIWGASVRQYWRLTWQTGDGPSISNAWAHPIAASDFSEIDLGVITIAPVASGTQRWSGQIDAYTLNSAEAGELDYLILCPASEAYWRLEGATPAGAGTVQGYDLFTLTTAGVALNARSAPLGGSWVTSGATTDFVAADAPGSLETEARSTAVADGQPRLAVLGSTSYTDCQVDIQAYVTALTANAKMAFAIARYVNDANHAFAELDFRTTSASQSVNVGVMLAGVKTYLATVTNLGLAAGTWYGVRVVVRSNGQITGYLLDSSGAVLQTITGNHSALATGGTLATGKPGFGDQSVSTEAATRYYDNFYAMALPAEQAVINAGRSVEIRSDSYQRQSSDGASYGEIAGRGSRLFIPPAGDAGRTSRIVARATRNDPLIAADTPLGDSLTLSVFYRPRYLAVPR